MKPLYLLALFLVTTLLSTAQDTTWFDAVWRPTTAATAWFYRTSIHSNPGSKIADHFLNGRVQMTGAYADDSLKIRTGDYIWYDSTGTVTHRSTYVDNKEDGPAILYYPNGQIRTTGSMKAGKKEDTWIGYYPSGNISAKAKFKAGKQASGKFYKEDGSSNKEIKEFELDSGFPGGVQYWLRFLNKNLRYPDSAVDALAEGTVVILFKVSKEGKASEFRIAQPVNRFLDAEALRVLNLAGDWQPAIIGGTYADSYKAQPIVFTLTSN